MYAIMQLAGFQYSVEEGAILRVPSLHKDKGAKVTIDTVLLAKSGETTIVGTPTIAGAAIEAEVTEVGKDDKVLTGKYRRRTKYRKLIGHRQNYTEIKINKITLP
jgi:large subunit ribosomal protein L21